MIKKALYLFFTVFFTQTLFSQQAWKGAGDQKIHAGITGWGYGTGLAATYDYGITDRISLGGGANFYFENNSAKKNDKFFIFGRVNYHLNEVLGIPDRWDVYPGADIGIIGNTFGLGVHLGARYFINDKFGVYLEAGNNGSLGLSINI